MQLNENHHENEKGEDKIRERRSKKKRRQN